MSRTKQVVLSLAVLMLAVGFAPALYGQTGAQLAMTHHVRPEVLNGKAIFAGTLPATQSMQFDIVLPLRDRDGLHSYLQEIYDPTSPAYHAFLTPQEFTERFGPSQEDWDALVAWAETNGFQILGGTRDGRDLWLTGAVGDIEKALHVNINTYKDVAENRTFFAVDREPTVDLPFPIWHISGLDNDSKPHPLYVKKDANEQGMNSGGMAKSNATTGSGPSASFLGSDMRAAYYCNGTCGANALTGTGQNIALFEFAGTDLADLTTYYHNVGQTEPYTPTLVSTGGYSTTCLYSGTKKCDDGEQNLDMTQAMGMAPGSTMLYMYVCGDAYGSGTISDTACISAMVSTTDAPLSKQISCSWGWTPADPSTLDPYFEQMASQGQNFFAASGDSQTWSSSNEAWPADDANIVSVGGTDLTTSSAGGPWSAETAWTDSGGGTSPDSIPIPSWQTPVDGCSGCSKTLRNGPDVSANANFTFYTCGDQTTCQANVYGGTSFAAPMWAGYLALANQQAAANNESIGFINPIIYPAAEGASYSTYFHDSTSGSCGRSHSAATGYDLCTGWGSPKTTGLINLLAPSGTTTTTTAVSSNHNPSTYGQSVAFTATVTGNSPTGTVQFTIDGSNFGSPVTLVSGSATSGSTSTLTVGTHTVTAVYSGDSSNSGSTGTLSGGQVVSKVTTSTAVGSSSNPSTYGQSISFTATVTGSSPTGTVQFNVDGSAFGSPVTLSSGSATSGSITTLTVGTHTVTAVYSGDGNNNGSTGTLSGGQVVNNAGTTVTVGSSGSPSTYGQSVTLTATIVGQNGLLKKKPGASPSPSGTVTWSSNTGCGTTPVTANGNNGTASCTTSALPVGSDTVTANYSGDSNHNAGSGSTVQNVNQVTTTTSVQSSLDPSTYGQSVYFTASVTGSNPTGTVQFYVDSVAYGSPVTLSSGIASSASTTTLTVGTHTVSATYSGDTNNGGSSGSLSGGQVVQMAGSGTITVSLTNGTNPSSYGQSVTFTASIPGQYGLLRQRKGHPLDVTGSVTWSSNTGCGTTPVTSGNPGTATCTTTALPVGSDTVEADYSGDSNHNPGSGTTTQQVNPAGTTVTVGSSLDPSTYGQSVSFTATVTGNSPTGTVQFYVDSVAFGSPVTLVSGAAMSSNTNALAVGTHTVSATYSGDTNNGGGSGSLSGGQVVQSATSGVTVGTSGSPTTYGQSVTFTATISGEYGLTRRRNGKTPNPTGTVTWSDSTGCGTTPVDGNNPGTATCTTTSLPVGSDLVTGNYSGDSNHNPGSGSTTQVVNQASQTITCSGIPASEGYDGSFTASCSASSGLAVAYTGSGVCTNSGAMYTMNAAKGTCTVIANQPGNSNYSAAPQVTQGVTATKGTPTASFTGAPATAPYQSQFTVTATINDGVTPTITASTACSLNGNMVTMATGMGTCTTTAKWAATTNWNAVTLTQKTVAEKLTPVITWPTPDPITYGTPLSSTQLDATASYNNSPLSGTFTYLPASGKILTAGNQTLKVTFKPSVTADYSTVTDTVTLVVNQQSTTTTVTKTYPASPKGGQSVKIYVNVAGAYGHPTGTVTVNSSDGQNCTATLASGTGNCSLTFATGSYTLTGSYNGDNNNLTSTSSGFQLTVQ